MIVAVLIIHRSFYSEAKKQSFNLGLGWQLEVHLMGWSRAISSKFAFTSFPVEQVLSETVERARLLRMEPGHGCPWLSCCGLDGQPF